MTARAAAAPLIVTSAQMTGTVSVSYQPPGQLSFQIRHMESKVLQVCHICYCSRMQFPLSDAARCLQG